MTFWIKAIGALFVFIAAIAVTVVTIVTQYDYNQLKPTVTQLVKDATGRELTIAGDLDLAVSLTPSLVVSDIVFANAPWGTADAMATLKTLSAKVNLLSLLQGRIDIDYVRIDGLKLVLQTDGKGRANWEFEAPSDARGPLAGGELLFVPVANDVRLSNIDVTYIDGATHKTIHLLLGQADFSADGFDQPLHVTLAAAYQGVAFDAEADLGSLAHLVGSGGGAFPVDMTVTAPGLKVTVAAQVDQPQAGMAVKGTVKTTVEDGQLLSTLAGMELPDLSGLDASMAMEGSGTRYAFKTIDAKVRGSDIGGDLAFDLGGARPAVSGRLASKHIDLDELLGLEAPLPPAQASAPQVAAVKTPAEAVKVFSTEPLPFDVLKQVDANVSVLANRVLVKTLPVEALKTTVRLKDGLLAVSDTSFSLDGGDVNGSAQIDGAASRPKLSVQGTVAALDIGLILKTLDLGEIVTLPLSGQIQLMGSGGSVHDLMAGLNGQVRVSAQGGRIHGESYGGLTAGLSAILPWTKREDGNVINCLVADWPIENGNATAKTVALDTPGFSVGVTGNIDLGGELLHLTIHPQAKNTSLASFAVPVRLKGPLSAAYPDVDPKDLVTGTVGNIVKAPAGLLIDLLKLGGAKENATANPCVEALSGDKTSQPPPQPGPQPETGTVAPPPSPSTGNPIEDLGKALGGIQNLLGR